MAKTSPSQSKSTTTRTKRATKKTAATTSKPKTTAKKPPAKRAQKPKTPTQKSTAKRAPTKPAKTTKKPAPAKPQSTARKPAPQKETVKSLRQHVDSIDARLKRANTLTKKSVKSLETAFSVMEKRIRSTQYVDQDALNARVSKLSEHLNATIENTHQDIKNDLKSAVSTRDLDLISDALYRARVRLDEAEMTQAEALTRVNKHIAGLAKAIDERMRDEQARQQQSLHMLGDRVDTRHAQTTLRMNKIEEASADAIRKLGDQIVTLTTDMQGRVDQGTQSIRDKVADIGQSTEQSVENLRRKLERRLEGVEEAQKNLDSYSDRMISAINTRLDSLEYGLVAASPAAAMAHTPEVDTATIAETVDPVDPMMPLEPAVTEPMPETIVELAAPQPYPAATQPQAMPNTFGPVEYVPEPYVPPAAHPQADPYAAAPHVMPIAADPYAQTQPSVYADPIAAQTAPQITGAPQSFDPGMIADSDLPYDNPAYAETDTQNRPGHVSQKSGGSKKLPGITPRTLRLAGLALAVAGVGYFGLKSFTGQKPAAPTQQPVVQQVNSDSAPSQPADIVQPITPGVETTPMIGEYADNRGTNEGEPVEAGQSLEAAAAAGNPVAEFQLGVAFLDGGRTEEGLALIRSAANKDQPAAQYRLAKLYETGQGVAADPDMARQLTERAALNGNRIAMHDLALYYAEGRGGVETDITTAAGWFEKAAERGVVDSQFNLGVLFESGQGVPRNPLDAYVWYSIAASQGDQFAKERRDVIKGQIGAEDMARADERISGFAPAKIDEAANGIFRDLPWTVSEAQTGAPSADLVKTAQTLLNDLGYETGTPDGAMGPNTQKAIIEFQRSVGLVETGEVTAALIDRLEIASGA